MEETNKKRKVLKKTLKIVGIFVGIWVGILVILQLALSPSVLAGLAEKYSKEYIDADISFSKVKLSVIRNFPNLGVRFDSVAVTYPKDRFRGKGAGVDWYTRQGRGKEADTLMCFDNFSASVNLAALLAGKINVPGIWLSKPRIFALAASDKKTNWNIFKLPESQEDTTETETALPDITIGKIRLENHPHIIFSSIADSVRIGLDVKKIAIDGKISLSDINPQGLGLSIDSLYLTGRFPADTAMLKLDKFEIKEKNGNLHTKAIATTYLAMSSYGRMKLPIELEGTIGFPKDSLKGIHIEGFKASFADIPLTADADIKFKGDSIRVEGYAEIKDCKVSEALKYFGKNFWAGAKDLDTDAVITMVASLDGWYNSEKNLIPEVNALLSIPQSTISHRAFGEGNRLALEASLWGGDGKPMDLDISKFIVKGRGVDIDAKGSAKDILGKDPELGLDGNIWFGLDTLSSLLKTKDYAASGTLKAELKGKMNLSQISPYKFAEADLKGFLKTPHMKLRSVKDSIDIYADSVDIRLATVGNTADADVRQGERMLAAVASLDSLYIQIKDNLFVKGKKLELNGQNSAAILDKNDSSAFYPFGGKFTAGMLSLRDSDTSTVVVVKSDNLFKISPKRSNPKIPVLTLRSNTKAVYARDPVNRLGVRNLNLSMTAAMNSIERQQMLKNFRDSLSKRYPEVPKDSLFIYLRNSRPKAETPEWMKEEDFKKKDINFALDQNIARYFREWDLDGSLTFSQTMLLTPFLPLKNIVNNFDGTFNNNEIHINDVSLSSGLSNLQITGALTGLRRALLRNGNIDLNLMLRSTSLDFNQFLAALTTGKNVDMSRFKGKDLSELGDDEVAEMFITDSLAKPAEDMLFVVPSNINASIKLNAENVSYSKLKLAKMTSDLAIKERCIQFTKTIASSNMGELFFEGFYSTRSKKNLKTGFDLSLKDVTAEKVIEMVPAVDSIMPMLKSFKGQLNCEIAATADIDTTMNLVPETINGVIRINGNGLELKNDDGFKEIARILKFKDRESSRINKMSVEGMIAENKLEIFPFILDIDRYVLAMSGIQNLDTSFKYHISVIQSPLIFRLGIDLYGNFDDFKFKIGKAKYKSTNVPVFSSAIDQTRLNLAQSIKDIFNKGVDKAVEESKRQENIRKYKEQIDYIQAVDEKLDTLSEKEKSAYESQE